MTVEVIHFPAGIYPSMQRLTPDVGPGQSVSESPFIGAQTVVTYRGAERWKLEMQFDDLTGADRADMLAFVTRLRVAHNVFLCVNHTNPGRGFVGGGSSVTNYNHAGGTNILTLGATGAANVESWARAGDFISVNSQLKMVLLDVLSNGSGVCSLTVWPPLIGIVSASTPVRVTSTCGAFRMLSAAPISTEPPGYRTNLSITAVERINSSFVSDFL
jgi:hypothetical protein